MNAMVPVPAMPPVISIVDGAILADSRDVAAYFKREHKNVLAALRNAAANCSPRFAQLNFQPVYMERQPNIVSHYLMTRDAFAFAVLGFTGANAAAFKESYIAEFNRMADELARRKVPAAPVPVDLYDIDVLLPILAHMAQRAKTAEAAVVAAQPAVDFVDALAAGDDTWPLMAAAKALHQAPMDFIKWLKDRGDLYELGGNVASAKMTKRGLFTVVWKPFGGKPRPVTRLTGKGMVFYAGKLGVKPPVGPPPSPQGLLPGL